MRFMVLALAVACVAAVPVEKQYKKKSYEGYKVIDVTPDSEENVKRLHKLADNPKLDFWTEAKKVGQIAKVLVAPEDFELVSTRLSDIGMDMKVVTEDVQTNIDAERSLNDLLQKASGKNFDYNTYNRYESIMDEVQAMKGRCPSGFTCETYDIGQSVQGRPLTVFKISKGTGRKALWMDSLIHAREWLTGATLMKILDNLLTSYGSDADVTTLLDTYDWYFLPVMNPDGYIYSWDASRYWRKNMAPGFFCDGVDLNRNYDASWMTDGTSDFECIDTYGGPTAASEPETQAVQAEAMRRGADLIAWVSVHSFSSLWLTPWGNTLDGFFECNIPEDYADVKGVAEDTANAIMATYNSFWEAGSVCEVLYAASGATMDYVKASAGVKYTFTPELRGTDFVISPTEIEPSYREVWNGIKAMVASIERRS